ncbi:MAG: N-acetylmuramoyl-L-alanine amidase [Sterolibacteriaceae bacterium]|nr:N-acetylmuramoyl-L-alanine amidase [Sterolibacteriaceae bacterium]
MLLIRRRAAQPVAAALICAALAGCAAAPLGTGMPTQWRASPNFDERRPNLVILHHTTDDEAEQGLRTLTDPLQKVSAHYLIGRDGTLYQLVDERARAWHAGASYWGGNRDVNSASIGIELDNNGYEPFAEAQITSLLALLQDLRARYAIPVANVLGHADVAPRRKGRSQPHVSLATPGRGRFRAVVRAALFAASAGLRQPARPAGYRLRCVAARGGGHGIHAAFHARSRRRPAAGRARHRPARLPGRAQTRGARTRRGSLTVWPAGRMEWRSAAWHACQRHSMRLPGMPCRKAPSGAASSTRRLGRAQRSPTPEDDIVGLPSSAQPKSYELQAAWIGVLQHCMPVSRIPCAFPICHAGKRHLVRLPGRYRARVGWAERSEAQRRRGKSKSGCDLRYPAQDG